jgi:hypothetical protein
VVVLVAKEDEEEVEEGEAGQQLEEEVRLRWWLQRCGGVLGFLQFLVREDEGLVGWRRSVRRWRGIPLLDLDLGWLRGVRRFLQMKGWRTGMGFGCGIVPMKCGWCTLVAVAGGERY